MSISVIVTAGKTVVTVNLSVSVFTFARMCAIITMNMLKFPEWVEKSDECGFSLYIEKSGGRYL